MLRKYVFPDPNDRSKNDPCTIVDSKKVLGLYNQEHGDDEDMQKVTQKFRNGVKIKLNLPDGMKLVFLVGNVS